jgi:integrating conjugative element protein (TIGR03757 family)
MRGFMLLGLLLVNISAYAWQADVYVWCSSNLQGNAQIAIHKVLCDQALAKQLTQQSKGLVRAESIQQAKTFTKAHIQSLQQSTTDNMQAINQGINKIPAVVFNHKYVVYGMDDAYKASAYFQ